MFGEYRNMFGEYRKVFGEYRNMFGASEIVWNMVNVFEEWRSGSVNLWMFYIWILLHEVMNPWR